MNLKRVQSRTLLAMVRVPGGAEAGVVLRIEEPDED